MVSSKKLLVLTAMAGFLYSSGQTQMNFAQQTSTPLQKTPGGLPPMGADLPRSVTEKQEKARNDERQKRLVADTEKLLTLATQLHEDVAKTDKNVLSMDVVRRADEIEKLAHAVKERMKG